MFYLDITCNEYDEINKHEYDKSGKSKSTDVVFWFDSGDLVVIECVDWSEEVDFFDKLKVQLITKEQIDFINNEAYD